MTTPERRKQLKTEFNRPSFKKILEETKGKSCMYCGSDKGVDYHHIIPLISGGDNRLQNIIPLCYDCHVRAHGGRNLNQYKKGKCGLPKTPPPKNYEFVLEKYFRCEIGKIECSKLLGFTGKYEKLNDKRWYKEYLKQHGIEDFRNKIDILQCPRNHVVIQPNTIIGHIRHSGEECRTFIYSDAYLATHKEYKQEQLSFI